MKNFPRLFLFGITAAFSLFISSCGSNQQKPGDEKNENAAPASSLMQEGPAYDASHIDPKAAITEITLKTRGNTMAEMSFSDSILKVPAGNTIHLTLINESQDASMQHNFVVIESGSAEKVATAGISAGPDNQYVKNMPQVYVHTKLLKPGEKTDISFPAMEKGEYEFICTYPGHYTKMRGKFIVE